MIVNYIKISTLLNHLLIKEYIIKLILYINKQKMNIIYYLMLVFFLVSCGTNAKIDTTTNSSVSTNKNTSQSSYSNNKIDTKTRAS